MGVVLGTSDGGEMPSTVETVDVSTTLPASTIVNQFSQAKLPERTSHSWLTTMTAAAPLATGCGANRPNGTISWTTWLPATSIRCSGLGIRWKNQLSGPGIG